MPDIMNIFGEYTLWIFAGIAVLLFWKQDGVPLYKYLLDKINSKKTSFNVEPVVQQVEPVVQQLEQVEMPKVADGVRAVGITLINQDLSRLSIENKDVKNESL